MTIYYIDPTLGSDSNAGTSETAPWATLGKITSASAWLPGNIFKLRNGRTFTERLVIGANGTVNEPITVTNYGPDGVGLPLMRPSLANSKGVDFGGYAGIVVDGLDCKSTNNDPAIWFSAYQAGSNVLPVVIRNCRVTSSDTGTGPGIQGYVGRGFNPSAIDTWTEPPGPVLIENNYVYDTGSLGIGFGDYKNVTIRGNTVTNCCLRAEQIGIIISQNLFYGTLTWTLHAGSVYKTTIDPVTHRGDLRGLTGCETVRFRISGFNWSPIENTTVAVGSLALGEFRMSGADLYVNLGGVNPNGASESYFSFTGTRGWIVEDNMVLDTFNLNNAEGVGIQADAFVGYGIIRRNYVRTPYGKVGIASNDARSLTVTGNVVENTYTGAFGGVAFADASEGAGPLVVENNTAIVNGLVTDNAAFQFGGTKTGGSFKLNNNIVVGACNAGVQFYSPDAVCEVEIKSNCVFGAQNVRVNYNATLTESGNLSVDPLLRSDYMPMSTAVRRSGVVVGWTDYNDVAFNPYGPTIGALQYPLHVRLQLRETVAAAVTGLTTTGANVFQSRVYDLQESEIPGLLVYVVTEEIVDQTIGDLVGRRFEIAIEGQTKASSNMDDVLDLIALEVEQALILPVTVAGQTVRLEFDGSEISMEATDRPTGIITLRFSTVIYTQRSTPDLIG